jgi:hypothetical protein
MNSYDAIAGSAVLEKAVRTGGFNASQLMLPRTEDGALDPERLTTAWHRTPDRRMPESRENAS